MKLDHVRIERCQCGHPFCADVFIRGIGMRTEGRFDRPDAEFIVGKLTGKPTEAVVAREFIRLLREQLTADEMQKVIAENARKRKSSSCATHDYCDANVVMSEAMENCGAFRRRRYDDEVMDQAEAEFWNAAWKIARDANFDASMV